MSASVNLRSHAGEAVPRHARPDSGAAGGAGRDRAADDPSPLRRLPRGVRARARPARGGLPDAERRAALHLRRNGGDGVRRCQPLLARRPRHGGLARVLRRALGRDRAGLRARRRPRPLRVGRDAESRRGRRPPRGDRRRQGRLPDALGHVDRRRRRRPGHRRPNRRFRRARRGRRDLEPRRGAARDRRLGPRRRADELAQGAHVPGRSRVCRHLTGGARGDRDRSDPALLHGLAPRGRDAGEGRDAVLDGDLARPRARRRARDDPRGRAGGRPRAAPPPGPRRAGGREGHGARPVLARRRHLRGRHGDPDAGRHRRAGHRRGHAGGVGRDDHRRSGARCAARSSASGTSATSTSTT